jgi:hypothetical protein
MSGDYFLMGDKVSFMSKHEHKITGIITSIQRGTKWTNLEITSDDNKLWRFKASHSSYSETLGLTFIGKADAIEKEKAVEKRVEHTKKIHEQKHENTSKLWDKKVEKGDIILIKGRTHNWEAEVDELNYREGKVGIKVPGANYPRWDRKRCKTHQWIPMQFVLEIKKGVGITSDKKTPLPGNVAKSFEKDRYQEEFKNKGCTQIQYSNGEFISNSYAISKDKQTLDSLVRIRQHNGLRMMDSGDETVRYDETLNLFWVNTGCFD